MALLLTLARHGETADNAARIFQGQGGSGLNRLGREQASRLGARIRRSPPLAIVSSDLQRAVETAGIVSEACGVPVELDRGLREIDVGTWTGKSYDDVPDLFPEEWAGWQNGLDVRRGGGETYAELAVRLDGALAGIAERYGSAAVGAAAAGGSTDGASAYVLVVSHGAAIKSLVCKMLGVTIEGSRVLGGVANTALNVVERGARGRHYLHSWNDVAHLEGLVASEHSD